MSNPQLNHSKEPLQAISGLSQLLDKGKPVVTRGRKASALGGFNRAKGRTVTEWGCAHNPH